MHLLHLVFLLLPTRGMKTRRRGGAKTTKTKKTQKSLASRLASGVRSLFPGSRKPVPAPNTRRGSIRVTKLQTRQFTTKRMELLARHAAEEKMRGIVRNLKTARSPQIMHALVSRLAKLPAQPLIQIVPTSDASNHFEYSNPDVVFKLHGAENDVMANAKAANIPISNIFNKRTEESWILSEIQNPSGHLHVYNEADEDESAKTSVTVPIKSLKIHSNIIDAVKPDYSEIEKFAIPIYFIINAPRVGHMSLMILYQGVLYSTGFGFLGGKHDIGIFHKISDVLGKGAFYSPDYLIDPHTIFEKETGKDVYKYDIVDIGYFTPTHLDRLSLLANSSHDNHAQCTFEDTFQGNLIPLKDVTYSKISSTKYCAGDYLNCTSFITHIFQEKVNCSFGGYTALPVHPAKCVRIAGKLPSDSIRNWFGEYTNAEPFYSRGMHASLV